jgi:hypothetical protein
MLCWAVSMLCWAVSMLCWASPSGQSSVDLRPHAPRLLECRARRLQPLPRRAQNCCRILEHLPHRRHPFRFDVYTSRTPRVYAHYPAATPPLLRRYPTYARHAACMAIRRARARDRRSSSPRIQPRNHSTPCTDTVTCQPAPSCVTSQSSSFAIMRVRQCDPRTTARSAKARRETGICERPVTPRA